MAHACKLSVWEVEAGEAGVQEHPQQNFQFEVCRDLKNNVILKPSSGFVTLALGKPGGSQGLQAILAYLVGPWLRRKQSKTNKQINK